MKERRNIQVFHVIAGGRTLGVNQQESDEELLFPTDFVPERTIHPDDMHDILFPTSPPIQRTEDNGDILLPPLLDS